MLNRIRAHLPATMVGKTASIVTNKKPIRYKLVNNILMNNNLAQRWFTLTITMIFG